VDNHGKPEDEPGEGREDEPGEGREDEPIS
jgi:hypothetical protein